MAAILQKPFVKNTIIPALTPRAFSAWTRYKKEIGGMNDKTKGMGPEEVLNIKDGMARHKKERNKAFAWVGAKALAAAAFYNVTAGLYGVSARDNQLSFDANKAWGNASSVSLTVATGVASAMPAHWQDTVASVIIPAEWAVSVLRMMVEQKVWKKYGFTSDPAGVLLTPVLAGTLELAYKCTVNYPQDTQSRLVVGLTGIYGNLVRIAHAGLIVLAGAGLKKAGVLHKDAQPNA